jgi:NADH:ubiquinone oxidoreductase subunit 6 (subunit J)
MWALLVGAVGVLTVAIAGTVSLRRSKTADERTFHISHNVSFYLSFLIFFVVPGILAALGVIDDPLFGPGPTFPLATAMIGVAGVLVVALAGAVVVRRNKVPAKRGFLIRVHFYMGLTFLVFFTLPGILADLQVIPDAMPGLGTAADLFFFFFLLRWSERQLEQFRAADKAGAGSLLSSP